MFNISDFKEMIPGRSTREPSSGVRVRRQSIGYLQFVLSKEVLDHLDIGTEDRISYFEHKTQRNTGLFTKAAPGCGYKIGFKVGSYKPIDNFKVGFKYKGNSSLFARIPTKLCSVEYLKVEGGVLLDYSKMESFSD